MAQCQAQIGDIRTHRCGNRATSTVSYDGSYTVDLCGVHKRQAEKWRQQGRLAKTARFWWRLP